MNPYETCVSNRIVNGKQHTVAWHVYYLKSSRVDPKVNDDFQKWLDKTHGSDDIGHVEASRRKVHDYLAMTLDYTEEVKLKIDMRKYLDTMIAEFPHTLSDTVKCPWTDKMFKLDKEENNLRDEKRTIFHSFLIKEMFLTKRGRADVQPAISFLASRVKKPTTQYWMKLLRVISYLKCTRDNWLTLEEDNEQTLYWYVDVDFAVHADMKSHTGSVFSLGKGMIVADSTKQKVNAINLT